MPTRSYPKGSSEKLSPNFKANEFDCHCRDCSYTFVDEGLVKCLQALREALGCAIVITSGYRCDLHQQALLEDGDYETVKKSTHQEGRAADIWTGRHSGLELEKAARGAGFLAVGVGREWAHVDTRQDRERRWFYEKR